MKKLTIEHLAAYLPYGVKCVYQTGNGMGEHTDTLNSIDFSKPWIFATSLWPINRVEHCKLILRPISDLTSEITHNGETFVPNERMLSDLSVDRESIHYLMEMFEVGIGYQVEWQIIQKLHSWHFDTFGLIEAGLAIDINTLTK